MEVLAKHLVRPACPPTSSYLSEPRANLKIMRSIIFTFQLLRLLFISTYKKKKKKKKKSKRSFESSLRFASATLSERRDATQLIVCIIT